MTQYEELNILMVEDDDFEAAAITRAFRKARICNTISRAHDGFEALQVLRGEHPGIALQQPLILLVDLKMPRMDGHEFLELLRRDPDLRRTVAFVLTTSSDQSDIDRAYERNVAGYLTKSTAGEDFKRLLSFLEDYWLTVHLPSA